MKLYEIDAQQAEIEQLLAANDGVLPDDIGDLLELNNEQWRAKLTGYAQAIKTYNAESKAFADEIKALQARKKTVDTRAQWLKGRAEKSMLAREVDAIDGVHALSFRESTALDVFDESAIPSDYMKMTTAPDKTAITKAIKAGNDIAGAKLVTNQNLQVK